jgi:hypothetical protein
MTKAKKRVRVSRSAKSGEFVPEKFAETHPASTVQETVERGPGTLHRNARGSYTSGDDLFMILWDSDNEQWLIYKKGNTEPEVPKF